jgi:hypothetical protein
MLGLLDGATQLKDAMAARDRLRFGAHAGPPSQSYGDI